MIDGGEFLREPLVVDESLRFARGQTPAGQAAIIVEVRGGFEEGSLSFEGLQDLHVWLGSAIAWLRHARAGARKGA
jgi:hypothetical protein